MTGIEDGGQATSRRKRFDHDIMHHLTNYQLERDKN